ncbi:hypothetical protein Slin15195_G008720 [Septoria linicola]|uniref:Transmembrane protein n=1 Tax=Septoria linicola TaxID=215465 RepID=A0A9Q9EFS4_9PEZI|nr:hypothetical protein Slin14017_G008730 [Septoria linicola]USW47553.1 hypothetical protein Slin15195_G008720 [Septoria linicola]
MEGSGIPSIFSRSLFGDPLPAGNGPYTPATVPLAAQVVSMSLNLVTLPVLGACLTRRLERIRQWSRLPVSAWLLLVIYIDSFLFIFVTALLKDIGINKSRGICDGAILLCLVCYMSTKVLIYTFLVEKAWIVRGCLQRRMESRLYLFNCFGMLLPYAVAVVLNFIWRISFIDETGKCIIGMEKRAMMPLIIFEVVVNVYLNILFIIPLRKMYSYREGTGKARPLTNMKTLAFRTFIGSCATLISSVVNLTVLMAVGGEPGWLCLMLCNADILFCVLILHWATSFDSAGGTSKSNCSHPSHDPIAPSTVAAATMRLPEPTLQKREHFFSCTCAEPDFPEGCWRASPWDLGGLAGSGHTSDCQDSPEVSRDVEHVEISEEKPPGGMGIGRVISDASDTSSDMEIRPANSQHHHG